MNQNSSRAKMISLNGILLALSVLALFAATTLPASRLAFYALSSFLAAVVIVEFGVKAGWMFFAASSILSLIVLPDKIGVLPYVAFFGVYGIVKFYCEKVHTLLLEFFFKYLYFNLCLFLALYLLNAFLLKNLEVKLPVWALVIFLEIVFLIYDYVYTRFVQYYEGRLKKILKI